MFGKSADGDVVKSSLSVTYSHGKAHEIGELEDGLEKADESFPALRTLLAGRGSESEGGKRFRCGIEGFDALGSDSKNSGVAAGTNGNGPSEV